MAVRILTWNLQGRERPDLAAVADVVAAARADVVALQEVQRRQAGDLAARLGWWSAWRCKHWAVAVPAEGLALLAPTPLTGVQRVHLAHPARFWSWRRRIAVSGTVATADGPLTVVDCHLGAGVTDQQRARQAGRTIPLVAGTGCVAGDLNARPGSAVLAAYDAAGLRDAWAEVRPGEPGPTNWGRGRRDGPPRKRLDYVLVTPDLAVVGADVPTHGEPGFERFGALSDHLPVVVEVAHRTPSTRSRPQNGL